MKNDGKPFSLRAGIRLAVFVLIVVALLWGFRAWRDSLENAPVADSYREFLTYASTQSLAAQNYLQRYYQRYQRDTVAAQHFPRVCSSMTALLERDGLALKDGPWHTMTDACKRSMTEDDIHILP